MHGMKSRSGVARLGAGAAAFALAATTAVAVSAPAAAAEDGNSQAPGTSSAYGVDANLAVTDVQLLNVDPLPYVESEGDRQTDELLAVPAKPLLDLKVLETVAEGSHARATAVNLKALEEAIKAKVLEAKCTGGEGTTKIVELVVGGQTIIGEEAQPAPNTKIPPQQLEQFTQQLEQVVKAELILNKQVELDNGGVEVTALQLKVDLGQGTITKDLSVSSVTCGPEKGAQPGPSETDKLDEAPKPKAVEGDLAVTG